jgi:hypothetical protein
MHSLGLKVGPLLNPGAAELTLVGSGLPEIQRLQETALQYSRYAPLAPNVLWWPEKVGVLNYSVGRASQRNVCPSPSIKV